MISSNVVNVTVIRNSCFIIKHTPFRYFFIDFEIDMAFVYLKYMLLKRIPKHVGRVPFEHQHHLSVFLNIHRNNL